MSNKHGGTAFPSKEVLPPNDYRYSPVEIFHKGMTLRDYFAAKAMQGFAADPECGSFSAKDAAEIAYVWADAMLKARGAE